MGYLLEEGCEINEGTHGGVTALMLAVSTGATQRVKWMLEHGADPNIADAMHRDAIEHMLRPIVLYTFLVTASAVVKGIRYQAKIVYLLEGMVMILLAGGAKAEGPRAAQAAMVQNRSAGARGRRWLPHVYGVGRELDVCRRG